MLKAEDLLFEGKAGWLRDRPQLGSASGVAWHPESSASLRESQDRQHRLSPDIVTLNLPSHLLQAGNWCQTQGRSQEHLPEAGELL